MRALYVSFVSKRFLATASIRSIVAVSFFSRRLDAIFSFGNRKSCGFTVRINYRMKMNLTTDEEKY